MNKTTKRNEYLQHVYVEESETRLGTGAICNGNNDARIKTRQKQKNEQLSES
jgi:hypothetical protein